MNVVLAIDYDVFGGAEKGKRKREEEKKKKEKTTFWNENWNKKLEDDMYHTAKDQRWRDCVSK